MTTEKGTSLRDKSSATDRLMTVGIAYVTIKIMCEICIEHYLLLEILTMVKYMNILYYYSSVLGHSMS